MIHNAAFHLLPGFTGSPTTGSIKPCEIGAERKGGDMFSKRSLVTLILSCLLTSLAISHSYGLATATDSTIRWKFSKGQKYKLKMNQLMTQSMTLQGNPVQTTNNTTTYMTWDVKEVNDEGVALVESTVERMTMSMNTPMGQVEIDTDTESDAAGMATQIGSVVRPMIGVKMTQKMTPRGAISDVQIPEEALAGLKNSQVGQSAMNIDQIKEMSTKVSPVFPEEELKIGDSWNQTSTTKMPIGSIAIDNTYKYEGTTTVDDRLAHRIGITMKMDFPKSEGVEITVSDQDTTGTLYFDQEKGSIIKSEVDQDMTLKIIAGTHEVDQRIEQKMTATFEEVSS